MYSLSSRVLTFWVGLCALAVMLISVSAAEAAFYSPSFKRYGLKEGLPSVQVLELAQDSRGYVWAATPNGLARFDGNGIRVWQQGSTEQLSLPGDYIESLALDNRDRVLLGINGVGLVRLHADGNSLDTFPEVNAACGMQVWSLDVVGQTVWIGSNGNGVCILKSDGRIDRIGVGSGAGQLRDGSIYALRADSSGRVWIGTLDGLWRWEAGRLTEVAPSVFAGSAVTRISVDAQGDAWVSNKRGLTRLDAFDRPSAVQAGGKRRLHSAAVVRDRNGGSWIGTRNGLFREDDGIVQLLSGDSGDGFLTDRTIVLDMLHDHEGGTWFATYGQGLAYLPPQWRSFVNRDRHDGELLDNVSLESAVPYRDGFLVGADSQVYQLENDGRLRTLAAPAALGENAIRSILPVGPDDIWLGREGRITRINASGRVLGDVDLGHRNARNRVHRMALSDDGTVWVAVVGVGVEQRDRHGRLLRALRHGGPEGLMPDLIHQLRSGKDGSLWIASGGGVQRWDGSTLETIAAIGHVEAYDLVFTWHQQLWVASPGRLARFSYKDGTVRLEQSLGPEQGIPPIILYGLQVDDRGRLWATTGRGLLRWDGKGQAHLLGAEEGVLDTDFDSKPIERNGNRMLALSRTSLVTFDPTDDPQALPSSQLLIDGLSVRRSPDHSMIHLPADGKTILQADDHDFVVHARLVSFASVGRQTYRYRINGWSQQWIEVEGAGNVPMPPLSPGRYVVEIQAHPGDGQWVSASPVTVTVLPVWWKSGPALFAWVILITAVGCAGFWLWRRRQMHLEAWRMTLHRQHVAEQASLAKSRFLSTLGHEVRTPMTGVLGMSELLMDTALDERQRGFAHAIHLSGSNLLRLLDDALDMARFESGTLELVEDGFDLESLIVDITDSILPRVKARGLRFCRQPRVLEGIQVMGDRQRLRQIILNLLAQLSRNNLSGAVSLQVMLDPQGGGIGLLVHDGDLRPEAELGYVQFEGQGDWAGGGLGLMISRELVQAMRGTMSLALLPGCGTFLKVHVPLLWAQVADGDVTSSSVDEEAMTGSPLRVLMVEDEMGVAAVVRGLLQASGHWVEHAENGLQALAMVTTDSFDVALVDLDLPGIDGLSLARQLRLIGVQIPLLAVTARKDADAENAVLACGMNAYLVKPVTGEQLNRAIHVAVRDREIDPVQ